MGPRDPAYNKKARGFHPRAFDLYALSGVLAGPFLLHRDR